MKSSFYLTFGIIYCCEYGVLHFEKLFYSRLSLSIFYLFIYFLYQTLLLYVNFMFYTLVEHIETSLSVILCIVQKSISGTETD